MILDFLMSFIWRKALMALTGFLWIGFVLLHMIGNLLIFAGAETYNTYAHFLIKNPLLPLAEIFLVLFLATHVFTGSILWWQNKRAKPSKYAVGAKGEKSSSLPSRTMIYTGAFVLAFLILHTAAFKYGTNVLVKYNNVDVRDVHVLVMSAFKRPEFVAWYVVALVLVGVHLSHGFSSAFQSLGVNHPRYTPIINIMGFIYAVFVSAGFLAIPIYVKFFS
jgi:succinate dehydrogenase / fumarate reductase cytochrome b subunit